ncbi:MAG: T9SS type A sorting domain-containing protein [Chitinophagales bacterium]|nr:T9SS type A sorting domain-containing protein [Chitinophagales bacterium]
MKRNLSILIFLLTFSFVNAQYVTIPDANFRSYLKILYPECFNASNMMDTTCSSILEVENFEYFINNIKTLDGIQYFKNLKTIDCSHNQIKEIPSLPPNLLSLTFHYNQLTELPTLPTSLKYLHGESNQLKELPTLPDSLVSLSCPSNQLTELPSLPYSLKTIDCSFNQLTKLPSLPYSLKVLDCDVTHLTELPSLPDSLVFLSCSTNQLTELPALPQNLISLICAANPLTCLPILPKSIRDLGIRSTKIKCLPNELDLLFFDTIVPICTSPFDICRVVDAYAEGIVYNDLNNDGTWNSAIEPILPKQIIHIEPNNWYKISDANGQYIVKLNTTINNTWSCTPPKYATINPVSYSFNPDTVGLIDGDYNFGIHFIPNIKDLEVAIGSTVARPGFKTNIAVSVTNVGTTNQSNITVKLKKPNGYDVTATSITPTTISNDTLIWQNVSIDFLQSSNFYVELQVPKNAVLGTALLYEVWANGTQGDTTPLNNYAIWTETVRGSYDPNDKLVSKTSLAPNYDVEKDRLIYTIRFQNTGTDTAFYVRVKDEIPDNLNISTLRVINASHDYQLIVREKNIVEFVFPNIFLPDSGTNEPKSHGFVQFAIQPKPGLPIDTKIENNAAIYFDYNAPVITNFAITEVKLITGIANNKNLDFKLFPNPTNGQLTVDLPFTGNGSWILSDISGRQIEMSNINEGIKTFNLNLNDLPYGTYFLSIQLGNQVSTAKVMKF